MPTGASGAAGIAGSAGKASRNRAAATDRTLDSLMPAISLYSVFPQHNQGLSRFAMNGRNIRSGSCLISTAEPFFAWVPP
jgi:hypothetical protein